MSNFERSGTGTNPDSNFLGKLLGFENKGMINLSDPFQIALIVLLIIAGYIVIKKVL
jgi:hypothetical protein